MTDQGAIPKIGLEAKLALDSFDAAVKRYEQKVNGMNSVTSRVAGAMNNAMKTAGIGIVNTIGGIVAKIRGTSDEFNGVKKSSDDAGSGFTWMAAKAVALGNIMEKVVLAAVKKVTAAIKDLAVNCLNAAARVQELSYVSQIMANNAGISQEEIQKQVETIKSLGIRTDEAYNAVIKFMQSELDMTKAAELARVAQDAAVIAQTDSSDAYQRLIYAVTTYNTETLRTMGFNLRSETVFKQYADSLGKTSEQLTQTERSQAFLNAVIAEGGKIAGAYEAAMETPGKQMRSWKRDVFELTRVLGAPFLNAYANVAKALRDVTQAFTKAIDVGGPFHKLMLTLGAVAAIITEQLGNAARAVSSFVISLGTAAGWQKVLDTLSSTFNTNFNKLISDAAKWGSGFIESFANGIIDGVVAVINALAYVGEIISSWLSPGSPPKLLPDIDKWGKSAMGQYLKGFTQADFNIFKDIGNVMQSFIKSKAGEGDTSFISKILGGRKALAAAIETVNRVGQVTDSVVNKVAKAAGLASKEFKAYVKAMLQSELAAKALSAAQANLVRVTSQYDAILKSLNDQLQEAEQGTQEQDRLAEIEQAMATGLLTESEYAALANEKRQILLRQQIRATEEARDKDVAAAQDKVDAAQQQMDAIAAQIELQKSAIEVQIEQNDLLKEQIKLMKEAAAAAGGAGKDDLAEKLKDALGGAAGGLNIQDKMKEAIEGAKKVVEAKLGELWKSFKAKFKPIEDAWKNLKKNWGPVVKSTWEDIKRQLGNISTLFKDIFEGKWEKVPGDVWRLVRTGLEILWKWINIWVSSIDWGKLGAIILDFLADVGDTIIAWVQSIDWVKVGNFILDALETIGLLVIEYVPKILAAFGAIVITVAEEIGKFALSAIIIALALVAVEIGKWLKEAWSKVQDAWAEFKKQFVGAWEDTKEAIIGPDGIIAGLWNTLRSGIETAWAFITHAWEGFKKNVSDAWTALKDAIIGPDGIIDTLWKLFKAYIETAWAFVTGVWDTFKTAVVGAWTILKDAIVGVGGIVEQLWSEFKAAIEGAWDNVKDSWERFKKSLTDWWNGMDWGELGAKVVAAIVNAITSGAGAIWNAIKNALAGGGSGGGKGKTGTNYNEPEGSEAAGGLVNKRGFYELAEQGPELVIPANLTKALFGALKSAYRTDLGNMHSFRSGNSYNNSRTVNLEINPTYEQVQSPASIRYDLTAALMAARM